jgi:hypothetical protein
MRTIAGRKSLYYGGWYPHGTHFAYIIPEYMISPEDYYIHFIPASLFRMLRFAAFILAC